MVSEAGLGPAVGLDQDGVEGPGCVDPADHQRNSDDRPQQRKDDPEQESPDARAPSSRAASIRSPGMFCRPANSTRHMNEVVSQMSGIATENSTMSGLRQPADLVRVGQDAGLVQERPMRPKLSIIRNFHSRPATIGAIMSG